jgi:hypothetical protein
MAKMAFMLKIFLLVTAGQDKKTEKRVITGLIFGFFSCCCEPQLLLTHNKGEGEKKRVYISDTAFVHPYSLLLFGRPLVVKHQDRKVLVGDWVEVPIAAQTGALFRELRVKMDAMLRKMIDDPKENSDLASGIVNLIQSH